jgi:predicted transposase/invertase (TIGR01784 family)
VELENLEIQPGTYVDKKLKKFSTDMLFKTTINKREGYVYFLFEHKSYPDRLVALQLLTYMVQIWNQKVNRENATHIPMIIPMVIYHGKSKWNIGTLEDLILDFDLLPEEAKQMIPDYHYQVYDLSRYSDEEIKGHAKLRIMISILKAVFGNSDADALQTIVKAGAALAELEESEKGIEYFEVCLRYILDSRLDFSTEQLNIIIRELNDSYKEGSELTMTLAEVLREEGRQEVRDIERYEAKKESLFDLAMDHLALKFGVLPADCQEKIATLDLKMLQIFNINIENFKTIEDVKKFLGI